ncbi:hypothetical protein DSM106972_047990 [Dulcicalothrix desertica PCC 7102]|uniref:Uncharacterized protein n=1 Tax=Dulcicalothrix desertica PCC 7102 TaxID=232991 RepID=A0A433VCQ5_9CYAN|nr:STM4015 family protein [Dulcicalothrix desertica]RUT03885.1 hypothetical protein DSM106972_047990 [Dulcicalothrix desertica PCC 7102]TWH43704.1 hypothetical protein CAL7102_07448 [Dulcicalothrix desertica PCC 7102]
MSTDKNLPREFDVVLGGEAPPPLQGAVLGGIKGVKKRLTSSIVKVRIDAVNEALQYGESGLNLVIAALQDESSQVQLSAYLLLRERTELEIKQAIKAFQSWKLPERLEWYSDHHVSKFFNKEVEDFDPQIGITNPTGIAYAVRCEAGEENFEIFREKLESLTQDAQASKLEALVIGMWDEYGDDDSSCVVDALVSVKDKLKNLKAIFIGDIEFSEWMISSIEQSDISPLLRAYPLLEVIQLRGASNLQFSQLHHENLKAIIIESGALTRETIAQICDLQLPALQHLEIWLGSYRYGGNSTVDDLMPILEGNLFPRLSFLGLRNSNYSDDIACAIVNTLIVKFINILDLAMGTLSDEGAEALLNCSAINKLDILNVHENYLSDEMIMRLSQLDCQLVNHHQKREENDEDPRYRRYCSIAE